MKFEETSIPQMYQQNLRAYSLDWEPLDTRNIHGALILAIASFLGDAKSKEHKVALVVEDLKGNFKMAGIVAYHKNEKEPNLPGNWSFVLTFNPEDVKDAEVHKANDTYFQRFMANALYDNFNMGFANGYVFIHDMIIEAVNVLLDWLDKNADQPDHEVTLEGYFVANVAIDGDKKIFSITPDGSTKRLIKSDADIQK